MVGVDPWLVGCGLVILRGIGGGVVDGFEVGFGFELDLCLSFGLSLLVMFLISLSYRVLGLVLVIGLVGDWFWWGWVGFVVGFGFPC